MTSVSPGSWQVTWHAALPSTPAVPVDAAGADLSGLETSSLRALDGVTWTRETTWPPAIAGRVRAHSEEAQPGVYRIRIPYGGGLS